MSSPAPLASAAVAAYGVTVQCPPCDVRRSREFPSRSRAGAAPLPCRRQSAQRSDHNTRSDSACMRIAARWAFLDAFGWRPDSVDRGLTPPDLVRPGIAGWAPATPRRSCRCRSSRGSVHRGPRGSRPRPDVGSRTASNPARRTTRRDGRGRLPERWDRRMSGPRGHRVER